MPRFATDLGLACTGGLIALVAFGFYADIRRDPRLWADLPLISLGCVAVGWIAQGQGWEVDVPARGRDSDNHKGHARKGGNEPASEVLLRPNK